MTDAQKLTDTEVFDAETYDRVMREAGEPELPPRKAAAIVARQRTEFEATIRRAEARQRGEIIWSTHTCAEHGYEGVPKCPWPDCPNGDNRDIFRTVKLEPRGSVFLDEAHWRIFIREFINISGGVWLWREVAYLPDPPTPLESVKAKFMAACSEWADLMISDSAKQVERGGARWDFGDIENWLPKIKYTSLPDGELVDQPEAQTKAMRAGYQLLQDSYDLIAATKEPHE